MICVVGALALDLLVRKDRFRRGTSNPATFQFCPGGVGYRIYAHLDGDRMLFTALGSDLFGRWLMETVEQPGAVHPVFLDRYNTACYCSLMQSGELLYGAADMRVIERGLSWPLLRARLPDLGSGDFLVLEANLSTRLVRSLIRHGGGKTRVVFEAVSEEKLLRHADALRNLFLLKMNQGEFRALRSLPHAGVEGQATRSERWVRSFLRRRKIDQLLVTLGKQGLRLYRQQAPTLLLKPEKQLEVADTTGAGDRLLSAYLQALRRDAAAGEAPEAALRRAMRAVQRCIEEGSL